MSANGAARRQCSVCSRTFTKTEHLERHERSHTKEKPFQCKQCGRNYSRHDTLLRHQRSHRSETSRSPEGASPAMRSTRGRGTSLSGSYMDLENANSGFTQSSSSNVQPSMIGEQLLSGPANIQGIAESHFMSPSTGLNLSSTPLQALSTSQASAPDVLAPSDLPWDSGNLTAMMQTPLSMETFDTYFDPQVPSWFLDEDFDLGMLGTPIAATMADLAPNWTQKPSDLVNTSQRPMPNTKQSWFTNIQETRHSEQASGTATPLAGPRSDMVDEDYRRTLHKRLQHRAQDQPLPSSDFLNLCVRMFFAHVNPLFPVVHAPTFRPSVQNSMLLLSICSVGSLFTGSDNAAEQGIQIFERLNKAVLATWDRLITRDASEVIPMIQAALIGQTFGLLSGHPKHLAIVDSFHGTVISWARRFGVFEARQNIMSLDQLDTMNLEKSWKSWARNEELLRLRLGLHVHDSELTGIFHHEPLLRHDLRRIPQCASDEIFSASTADEWASAFRKQSHSINNAGLGDRQTGNLNLDALSSILASAGFTVYAALEGIAADITEQRAMEILDRDKIRRFHDTLVAFHQKYLKRLPSTGKDSFGLVVLWHLSFMSLYVDFDLLERAVGRDGPPSEAIDVTFITIWAASTDAKRCVVHASLIHKNLEKMPIGVEPAIHVPRAMFLAALSWYCFIHYGPQAPADDSSTRDSLDFPEIRLMGFNAGALLFESNGFRREKPKNVNASGALCGLIDLLQRIGHWEIARRFGPILGALIHQETG